MWIPGLALVIGLALLVWSADRFILGAAATARRFQVPPLLIGLLIIGFGTSAPELLVSGISATQGKPGLALGNAWGSNIANIALVLGFTALVMPIMVRTAILRTQLPILAAVTALAGWQLAGGQITRLDAVILLLVFTLLMTWSARQGMQGNEPLIGETNDQLDDQPLTSGQAWFWLFAGLILLLVSARMLVWAAVTVATDLGVDEVIIGLTVVAVGTSLPELAAAIAAVRRQEHDLALGNILGSNLFNTLAVVGLAGVITPITVMPEVFWRDWLLMALLTLLLLIFGWRWGTRPGRINRIEGGMLLLIYLLYLGYLVTQTMP